VRLVCKSVLLALPAYRLVLGAFSDFKESAASVLEPSFAIEISV